MACHQYPEVTAAAFQKAHFQLGGLFVLSHIICYYILGMKMLQSSRPAGVVSLYHLAEYIV